MDGRADIVDEPRQGELGRTDPAADGVAGLEHRHGPTGLSEDDGGGQSVWTGSDDDGVVFRQKKAPEEADRPCGTLANAKPGRYTLPLRGESACIV